MTPPSKDSQDNLWGTPHPGTSGGGETWGHPRDAKPTGGEPNATPPNTTPPNSTTPNTGRPAGGPPNTTPPAATPPLSGQAGATPPLSGQAGADYPTTQFANPAPATAASAVGATAGASKGFPIALVALITAVVTAAALIAGWKFLGWGGDSKDPTVAAAGSSASSESAVPSSSASPTTEASPSEESTSAQFIPQDSIANRCRAAEIAAKTIAERATVSNCDGDFAMAGQPNTDHLWLMYRTGAVWKKVPASGRQGGPLPGECYKPEDLQAMGFPASIHQGKMMCDRSGDHSVEAMKGYVTSAVLPDGSNEFLSRPACDGRYVLIVDSIHVPNNSYDALRAGIGKSLAAHPGSAFAAPGACGSLRERIDGQDIYPIYYDFGTDRAAMCERKAAIGGNGRVLQQAQDYNDPC